MIEKRILRTRAPLRISYSGGGTDISPFAETEGGVVLSTTIDQYAYCSLQENLTNEIIIESQDYEILEIYQKISDMNYDGKLALIKAHLKKLNLSKKGYKLTIAADAPPGSGLGSSSAISVALVGILQNRDHQTSYDIANTAYDVERNELGISGGKQDQYASSFGGFNFIEFKKKSVIVNPLRINNDIQNELLASTILCDTKIVRKTKNILKDSITGYQKKNKNTVEHLKKIKELTFEMKNYLLKGDILNMAEILNQNWEHKKKIDKSISNKKIDQIYSKIMGAGAMGGKLLGAGGGGHFMFICDPTIKPKLSKMLVKEGCEIVKFNFDAHGLQKWSVIDGKVFC